MLSCWVGETLVGLIFFISLHFFKTNSWICQYFTQPRVETTQHL